MKTIDRIVFDALAARRGVVLPDVGTLEVRRVGARRLSDTHISPPRSEVTFSHEWGSGTAGSLVAAIAAERGIGESEAAAEYSAWLDGARREQGSVDAGAAGEIVNGRFIASEELMRALNPAGGEAVTVDGNGRRSSRAWLWIVALVAIALAAFCLFKCCGDGGFRFGRKAAAVVEEVAPAATPLDAAGVAAAEAARAAATEAEGAMNGKGALTGKGDRYAGTDRFHVIVGAFAVESNADNYIARLKREHPELTPVKLPHPVTGYNMVSIIQTSTRRQAVNRMNLYWDIDENMWIYEQQ